MSKTSADLLASFPKVRPVLPPEYEAVYAQHYKENRDGGSAASGLAQKMESWMHRKVAADTAPGLRTLEVGAGTLNHLPYEHASQRYDVVEPFNYLYESSPYLGKVNYIFSDISQIPDSVSYDRVLSIATFEHICELPAVVARCGLLLTEKGNLRVVIPSEGTVLWKLGYTITTGLEFKKRYGLDYEVLMRHEHVNTAAEIEAVLRYFFKQVEYGVFGVARSLSLYQFFACRVPDRDLCAKHVNL